MQSRETLLNKSFRLFLNAVFKWYCRVEVFHQDRLPNQSVIFCANHCSHIDGAVLYHSFYDSHRNMALVAASDYFFNHTYHAFAQYLLPLMPIERDASLATVREFLNQAEVFCQNKNNSLVIFPEGTRSYDNELFTFKPGAAILSEMLKIPIVPIYIHGAIAALPKDHFIPRPHAIKLYIAEPIQPEQQYTFEYLHEYPELSQQYINKVRDSIAEIARREVGITLAQRSDK